MVTIKHGWEIHDHGGQWRFTSQNHSTTWGFFVQQATFHIGWVYSWGYTVLQLLDVTGHFNFMTLNLKSSRTGRSTNSRHGVLSYDSVPKPPKCTASSSFSTWKCILKCHIVIPKKVENRDLPLFQRDFTIFLGVTKNIDTYNLGMFMRRLASLPSKGNSAPTQ
jgi:hypothetical protein